MEIGRVKFENLCHLIRAAASICEQTDFVVIGSQSVLGSWPSAPESLLVSEEIDAWPKARPDLADLVDGTIGELSPFHGTFGYYFQGVGPETAVLSNGWEERLVRVTHPSMGGGIAWCLDLVDLLAAKCAAGRDKDIRFVGEVLRSGKVSLPVLEGRIRTLETSGVVRDLARTIAHRAAQETP